VSLSNGGQADFILGKGTLMALSDNILPKMTILSAQGAASFTPAQLADLSRVSQATTHQVLHRMSNPELISLCRDAEILGITRRATINIDEELVSGMLDLKGIAVYATGYDWVDLTALKRHGIKLTTLPDYSTQTVAEHTWGMILTMSRRIHLSDRMAKGELPQHISLRGSELAGKTLGIIGMGRIGKVIARIANAFSMDMIWHDKKDITFDTGTTVAFDDVLSRADIIVLACSCDRSAPPIIDLNALARMRPGAYLINPVRQALVDNEAVLQTIKDKRLAGYAIDDKVFTNGQLESIEPGRILQTGHTAWYSNEAMARGTQCWVDNLIAMARRQPINLV
jgi:lactate dehydrogenase-like 2-hydroxyacid dehydrogenase